MTSKLRGFSSAFQLYSQVKTPKECVMDATVVRNLSSICRQQAHQMSANINQFKHEEYVMKLKRGMSIANSGLDKKKWLMLGKSHLSVVD